MHDFKYLLHSSGCGPTIRNTPHQFQRAQACSRRLPCPKVTVIAGFRQRGDRNHAPVEPNVSKQIVFFFRFPMSVPWNPTAL
jgi:hypothetical protein